MIRLLIFLDDGRCCLRRYIHATPPTITSHVGTASTESVEEKATYSLRPCFNPWTGGDNAILGSEGVEVSGAARGEDNECHTLGN